MTLPIFPTDVIIEIFKNCEWRDVLNLRQIYWEASKAWEIWAHLVSSITSPASYIPTLHYIERPMHQYTSLELETLLLRWKKVEIGWQMVPTTTFRHQLITDAYRSCTTSFVPGGRWFLVFKPGASAVYYDLDSDAPIARALIPEQGDVASTTISVSEPDIDTTSPVLTFNICLAYLDGSSTWLVQIWRIMLVASQDGAHNFGSLSATRVVAFGFVDADTTLTCESLLGHQLCLATADPTDRFSIIIDWTQVIDGSFDFPRQTILGSDANVVLLPHKRIFICFGDIMFILKYIHIPIKNHVSSAPDALADLKATVRANKALVWRHRAIWSDRPHVFFIGASGPKIVWNDSNNKNIHGFFVDDTLPVDIFDTTDRELWFGAIPADIHSSSRCIGYHRTICKGPGSEMAVMSYSWPDLDNINVDAISRTTSRMSLPDDVGDIVTMDEGTGRIICYHPMQQQYSVVDIAV